MNVSLLLGWGDSIMWLARGWGRTSTYCMTEIVRWDHAVIISTVNTGILFQILIVTECLHEGKLD